MTNDETRGRTALITGASAGIGEHFARVFAAHGFDVVLVARRLERLEQLGETLERDHGIRAFSIASDLADPGAPEALLAETERRGLAIDALVNNAGYGVPGFFRDEPWKTHAAFLQVMVTAPVHLAYLCERGMIERGWGRIINVSSLAGLAVGAAGHTLYAAAKAFLIKFSESMSLEHRGDDINVCAVCPGFTYSEFHDVVGNRSQVSKLPSFMWMSGEAVARQGYDAVMRGDSVYVNGPVNKAIAAFTKLLPHRAAMGVMHRQSARIRIGERSAR